MGKRRKAKTDSHRCIAGDSAEEYSSSNGPSAIEQGSEDQLAKVRKFWQSLSTGQRSEILSTSLDDIWAKLPDVTDDEARAKLQEGIRRLCENGSCKRWQWTTGQPLFCDETAFRLDVRRQHIEPHRHKYIPDTGKTTDAEKQLQKRISALTRQVKQQQSQPKLSEVERSKLERWRQPPRTNLANFILAALHNEHKYLYNATIAPIILHICSVLPDGKRYSSLKDGNGQLCLENRDLDELPYQEFEKVDSWLDRKVHDFEAAACQQVGKQALQHLQPFKMTDNNTKLAIRADWLQQLQEAVADVGLSAQQKAPLKQSQRRLQKAAQRAPAGSQNTATDPVLDWIFNAHQPYHANDQGVPGLPPETVTEAWLQLMTALVDSQDLDEKCDRVRELMGHIRTRKQEMSRVENSEANRLKGLPDVAVITCQLRQEIQLTHARKSNASFRCHLAQMQLCKLLNEARQIMARQNVVHKRVEALEEVMPGNPASRDLRKLMLSMGILDECQALMQDMGALDHSYATNSRERDRAADREGEYMEEHDRLLKWADFLGNTNEAFRTVTSQKIAADDAIRQAVGSGFTHGYVEVNTPETHAMAAVVRKLGRMRETFKTAVWPKLCTDQQEAKAYKASDAQLKHLENLLAEGCAALPLLEAQLCNAACSDLGGVIMDEVLLPLLRQRLTTLADDFCAVHPQAGRQPGSTALTPIELLLAEEDQTAGKRTPQGSISTGSNRGQQEQGLDHKDAAASLRESSPSRLQSDRHQKGGSTTTTTISSSISTSSRDDRSHRSSSSTSQTSTAGGSSSTMTGINCGSMLVGADNLETEVGGADHGGNHDSDATKAALEANKKLATAASFMTEALEKDYARKYEQLMAEEAAREAAESVSSAAAVDAPAALSAVDSRPGTDTCAAFRDPYFDGGLFNFESCHLSPLHCKPSCCASYPDDFMMECASDAEARVVVKGVPNAKWGVSAAERDAVSGYDMMPKLEVQAGLKKLICCPVSKRVLVEPVFAADGHTYNAWVMQPWLQVRDMSPCGGAMLSNKFLVSNVVVRCLVYQQFILHDKI